MISLTEGKKHKKRNGATGHVIWLTGISGAGKTTLAKGIADRLRKFNKKVELIDGNDVRCFFDNDLGYSEKERSMNIKRIVYAASLLEKNGICVVVANIAPYYEIRDFIRRKLKNYTQIYVKVSIESAIKRDTRGYYGRYIKGEEGNIIGLDDRYDVPRNPDVIIDTEKMSPAEALTEILGYLESSNILNKR